METLRRAVSFVTGRTNVDGEELELPHAVERAYVLSKDVGHRGPVVGGFQLSLPDGSNVVVTVTPSGLAMVTAESASVICQLSPDQGDAFTCSIACTEGLLIGCQSGKSLLAKVSGDGVTVTKSISSLSAPVTCLATMEEAISSVVAVGNEAGNICIWSPQTSHTIALSLSSNAVTACVSIDSELWASFDKEGIRILNVASENEVLQVHMNEANVDPEGMATVTNMVFSSYHGLVICLSSCSDVFLIDKATRVCLHRYPATLMTCGASLTSLITVERKAFPGSTFLMLGGVDGSLCIRELNKRPRDGKLQCVLHRCFDRLSPSLKIEGEFALDPSEGVPITSLYVPHEDGPETCIAGDASCALFAVRLNLRSVNPERAKSGDATSDGDNKSSKSPSFDGVNEVA